MIEMKNKKNVYMLFEYKNEEKELKYLLENIQQMFVIPEGNIDIVFDSLFKTKEFVVKKNIDMYHALYLVNELLTTLDQDINYDNQYYLFSILGLSDLRMNNINQFLIGIEMCTLYHYS